ncbi:phosphotransferase enzyme family protein [Deinococcus yavapaiensis]|uniref:Ser/Thr protein kinase RdoA (MazF antagonist) n=1 Tax=Deinococcus yavapaiensis KR-236 TaxID=694435 RepID=A0A318S0K8_9DEIO|nr:phosphotransferase [Deinococcus yavapaiensis]PYE50426.1 Ser/Thr protein kinase RdoA (MazF antagonist) [Deinococcus yavapaiensis KR-236]
MTLRPGAVPPLVPNEVITDALRAYDLPGPLEVQFLRRGFNDHYEVTRAPDGQDTRNRQYIMRIYLVDKPYIRGIPDIEDELKALVVLAKQGVPVSAPIARRDGDFMQTLDSDGHSRPMALFSYALGEELKGEAIGEEVARNLGQAIARMHAVADAHGLGSRRYTLDETFLVDRPVATLRDLLNEDAVGLEAYGEQLKAALRALPRTPGLFGFIHADLHSGNFRVLKGRCTLFDFDHGAQGWRAYDLCVLRMSLPDDSWTALLDGYRSVRPFTAAEEAALPLLTRVRQLWDVGDFLAMRASGAWGDASLSEQGRAQVLEQVLAMQQPPLP